MTKRQPDDTKLLMLPSDLVDRLKEVSNKRGTSLSGYAMEVFEEALKADKLGASLGDAVDAFRMKEIHRGAGAVIVPRRGLGQIMKSLGNEHAEDIVKLWDEAGRWYGKYLLGKLSSDDVLAFLRQDLLTSWNLDEVEFTDGDHPALRFTGFMMSEEFTGMLLSYVHGVMDSLGYKEIERDSLRGMATIRYLRLKNV